MIDKKDLRIGNKCYFFGVHTVCGLYSNEAQLFTELPTGTDDPYRAVSYENLTPIPLSEEWLIKFGCVLNTPEISGVKNYWNKEKDFSVDVESHILKNGIENLYYYRVSETRRVLISFVHKLQNLHYELKNSELEIK